jgi:hypothetical protein
MNAPISPLLLAQQKLAQMRADGIEVERLSPTEKALADPKSRSKAIRATCFECLGGEECPNVRREVGRCTAFDCALWHMRPYRKTETEADGTPFGIVRREAALAATILKPLEGALLASAARNANSAAAAIRARCVQCQGNRKDVTHCQAWFGRRENRTYTGCPLHPVRPYQKGGPDENGESEDDGTQNDDPQSCQ